MHETPGKKDFLISEVTFNPFAEKNGLVWLSQRINEGSFGPTASLDRSLSIESSIRPLIEKLKADKDKIKLRLALEHREDYKNTELEKLKKNWEQIKKGGSEELAWTEQAIALAAGYFEIQRAQQLNLGSFQLRDNQLAQIVLLLLNKGKYHPEETGRSKFELHTDNRGVGLPTGEGKTISFALTAAVMSLRGETVHLLEPNYLSAMRNSNNMGSFFSAFLGVGVGVVVDTPEKTGLATGLVVNEKAEINRLTRPTGRRKSYIWSSGDSTKPSAGQLINISGQIGRRKAWKSAIVYMDMNSAGFDYLEDNRLGRHNIIENSGQPDLHNVTLLAAEADQVMLDDARNPLIISEKIRGDKAWGYLLSLSGLEDYIGNDLTEQKKQAMTRDVFFGIWSSLELYGSQFEQGEGKDYLISDNKLIIAPGTVDRAVQLLKQTLSGVFASDTRAEEWLLKNTHVINSALEIYFSFKNSHGYLKKRGEIVLLDEFGFPLEKRQYSLMHQPFLQMSAFWREWSGGAELNSELLDEIINTHSGDISVSIQKERILPVNLLQKYGKIRFSSGSLLPAALSFRDLYQAETLALNRHMAIESLNIPQIPKPNNFYTVCLDGGIAEVELNSRRGKQDQEIIKRAYFLSKIGRAGLFIVPDIERAQELGKHIPGSIVITGKEELEKRGTLTAASSHATPGQIVITTWIAHRDVDFQPDEELIKNGGPEVNVVGILPTERSLWQALQRTWRGDIPGTRRLLISYEDLEGILNKNLYYGQSPAFLLSREKLHMDFKSRLNENWNKALTGDFAGAQCTVLSEILQYLRSEENTRRDQLLFGIVKEGHLEAVRDKARATFEINFRSKFRYSEKFRRQIREKVLLWIIEHRTQNQAGNWQETLKNEYGVILPNFSATLKFLEGKRVDVEFQLVWDYILETSTYRFIDFLNQPEVKPFLAQDDFSTIQLMWDDFMQNFIDKLITL